VKPIKILIRRRVPEENITISSETNKQSEERIKVAVNKMMDIPLVLRRKKQSDAQEKNLDNFWKSSR